MKKNILFGILAAATIATPAMADGFAVTETETFETYGTITVDTVKYIDGVYVAPKRARAVKPTPCRAASSLDLAHGRCAKCNNGCGKCDNGCDKCDNGCAKSAHLNPVRVKTYTEVIDHYQIYEPVVTYKPAGTYSTRRYIQAPNPHCGTCAR